jgi:hypothetical protein
MRQRSRRTSARRLVTAAAVGAAVGLGAFELTAQAPPAVLPTFCQATAQAGFDPWTGLPHGLTYHCPPLSGQSAGTTDDTGPQTTFVEPIPPEILGRHAIPVPLGFILGGAIVLLWWVRRRGVFPEQQCA